VCDSSCRGLSEVEWDLVAIVGMSRTGPRSRCPATSGRWRPCGVGPPRRPRRPERAAAQLCRGMLGDSAADLVVFGEACAPSPASPSAGPLRPARRAPPARRTAGRHPDRRLGPRRRRRDPPAAVTLREADEAAALLEHALPPARGLGAPDAQLVHANANGLSAMVPRREGATRGAFL